MMTGPNQPTHSGNRVWLVGAGPGDPELLTLKAVRLIESADVVLYDSLISPEILAYIPSSSRRVHVGKRCGAHKLSQEEINRLLYRCAKKYPRVVRLKGGDPFVFGRGGEEMDYLQQRGITVSIVPGISAAIACAAAVNDPSLLATDLVDWLVLEGMPFRKAHHVVGKLIALAEAKRKRLNQLTPAQLKQVDKKLTKDALKVFDLKTAMANRTVIGAPGKAELKLRLAYWNKFLRH